MERTPLRPHSSVGCRSASPLACTGTSPGSRATSWGAAAGVPSEEKGSEALPSSSAGAQLPCHSSTRLSAATGFPLHLLFTVLAKKASPLTTKGI